MTQPSSTSTPFSITTPPQPYRLLELPPELLSILTSSNAPAKLSLKSSSPTSDNTTKSTSEFLHLCTDTKSWAVRQVSTSNSVYITSPSKDGLTAISKPTSHLELIAINPSEAEISNAISQLLPIHPGFDDGIFTLLPSITEQRLVNSLPYPSASIIRQLRSLYAFQSDDGQLYIPSPQLLLQAWKPFKQHAAILTVSLTSPVGTVFEGVFEAIITDEAGDNAGATYVAVLRAVIAECTSTPMGNEAENDLAVETRTVNVPLNGQNVSIFVGQTLIKAAGAKGIIISSLLTEWKELVPDAWENHCTVDSLGDVYKLFKEADEERIWCAGGGADPAAAAAKDSKPAVVTGKRKWHERFAAQRYQH